MWAPILKIEACRICGTTERKHSARGLCNACRCRERYAKRGLSPYQKRVVSLTSVPEIVLAYIAGLIDGEGTVTAERPGRNVQGKWKSPRVRVIVAMTNEPIIKWLRETFGGALYIKSATERHKASFQWTLNGRLAIHLLEKLVPYLRVKLPQAKVAIKFGLIRLGATQTRRRTDDELAQLNSLKDRLLVLNKRGN